MIRLAALAAAAGLALLAPGAFAQEAHEPAAHESAAHGAETGTAGEEEGGLEIWKWANFLVLAGGIGYLVGKHAGPFFDARSQKIRKDMLEAEEARRQAEMRAAEVESRLANLDADIATLRAEAQRSSEAEAQRIAQQTAAEMARIQAHAEQEIVSAGKAARLELQRYSAELAIALAEQKIRARMTPETQDALVQGFVRRLESGASRAQTI